MPDYEAWMKLFSIPRPNGSAAERRTERAITRRLTALGIPYEIHTFHSYPYIWQCIGLWLIVSRTALVMAVWLGWGWAALLIALLCLPGGIADVAFHFPLISWPGNQPAHNILLHFSPPRPEQEIILSAHYDTKTEWLDHRQRMFFVKNLPLGILLTVLLGVLGATQATLPDNQLSLNEVIAWSSYLLGIPLLFLAWGLGLHFILGALRKPSQGAVDDGAACAILLGLAEHYHHNPSALHRTRLTVALFSGEEINMQGSRAYVQSRNWSLPTAALNLEVMAQNGAYVIWERDGTVFKLRPNSPTVIEAVSSAVRQVTGETPLLVGPVTSDGGSFSSVGIPAATLGTYDQKLRDRGFHCASDHLGRVVMSRLPEATRIAIRFVEMLDTREFAFPEPTSR